MAGDVLTLRRLLLEDKTVRTRLDALAESRPSGQMSGWEPYSGLRYNQDLEQLEADLDFAWNQTELDHMLERWSRRRWTGIGPVTLVDAPYGDQVRVGAASVGLGMSCGRGGYGRGAAIGTIERVARSIAHHAGGASWAVADDLVASEVAPPMNMNPMTIAGYRKRLRDRLEHEPEPGPDPDRVPARLDKTCEECGAAFTTIDAQQQLCGWLKCDGDRLED